MDSQLQIQPIDGNMNRINIKHGGGDEMTPLAFS